MRLCFISGLAVLLAARSTSFAQETQIAKPVLIELFTSEGCSSCPPADAWLQRLDASQPLPNFNFIVVSEHVTYWNQAGWKDPYSEEQFTVRQSGYVRALGLSTPYTPQLIANGTTELHLNDAQEFEPDINKAAEASTVPVTIRALSVEQGTIPILRAQVEVSGVGLTKNADIVAIVALDHATDQVARGENGGRRLTHVAVARRFERIGTLVKGKRFVKSIEMKLPSKTPPAELRLIVFAQEPDVGRVLGVSMLKTNSKDGN